MKLIVQLSSLSSKKKLYVLFIIFSFQNSKIFLVTIFFQSNLKKFSASGAVFSLISFYIYIIIYIYILI